MSNEILPVEALADPASFAEPARINALYRRLRDEAPVARAEPKGYRPFYAVTRHADIVAIESAPERYLAGPRAVLLPEKVEEIYLTKYGDRNGVKPLTHMDGEYHRGHREVTLDWFMPKALRRFEARVAEIAREFVNRMEDLGGACDFAKDVAFEYPLRVILTLMGVPREDEAEVLRMTQRLFSPADKDLNSPARKPGETRQRDVVAEFADYYHRLGEKRRAEPQDDIITTIANGQVHGCPMARHEMTSYYVIVSTAGHDTTAASIAGGMSGLLDFPDQMRKLRADLSLLGPAADEFVRWTAPVKHFMRTSVEDIVLHGETIAAGEALMLCYASGCRDERVYADAEQFRVDRPANPRHLAFGLGPHFCLGRSLALMEIKAFYAELLPRLKSIEPAGDRGYSRSVFVSGLKQLPVRYRFG